MKRDFLLFVLLFLVFISCEQQSRPFTKGETMAQVGNITISLIDSNNNGDSTGSLQNIIDGNLSTYYETSYVHPFPSHAVALFTTTYKFSVGNQYVNSFGLRFSHQSSSSPVRKIIIQAVDISGKNFTIYDKTITVSKNETFEISQTFFDKQILTFIVKISLQVEGLYPSTKIQFYEMKLYNSLDDSGLIAQGSGNKKYSIGLFEPNSFLAPLRIQTKDGARSITLVKTTSPIATPLRIKINPEGNFAKALLGANNNGIVSLGGKVIS